MLADEVPTPSGIHPCDMNRVLPFDEPHHVGRRILQRHTQQPVHGTMPLFDLAFPLLPKLRNTTPNSCRIP